MKAFMRALKKAQKLKSEGKPVKLVFTEAYGWRAYTVKNRNSSPEEQT